jgi:hypothetical protein
MPHWNVYDTSKEWHPIRCTLCERVAVGTGADGQYYCEVHIFNGKVLF